MHAKQLFGTAAFLAFVAPGAFAQPPESLPHPEPHHRMLQQLDTDSNGQITRDEFEKGDLFNLLDKNGDGVLSREDHPEARIAHRIPGHLLRLADEDHDGAVNALEWSYFLAAVDPNGKGVVDHEALHQLAKERFGKGREDGQLRQRRILLHDEEGGPPSLSVEKLNEMFKTLDKNADGALQSDELPEHTKGFHRRHE